MPHLKQIDADDANNHNAMLMNIKLLQNHDSDYVVNSIWHFGGNYHYPHHHEDDDTFRRDERLGFPKRRPGQCRSSFAF
jgi:hypothetical protein